MGYYEVSDCTNTSTSYITWDNYAASKQRLHQVCNSMMIIRAANAFSSRDAATALTRVRVTYFQASQ